MLPGTFYRNLQKCNKNIRIYPSETLDTPSGLYVIRKGELHHVCGVDNRDIPERHYSDFIGHIIKRGWRVTMQILIAKRHIRQKDAERVFGTRFSKDTSQPTIILGKKKNDLTEEIQKESNAEKVLHGGKEDGLTLQKDMMMDFAKEVEKEEPMKDKSMEKIYEEQQKGITDDRV